MKQGRGHILVTGSHRSGTTWVGQTLAKHRMVKYLEEPFNVDKPNEMMRLRLKTWFVHYSSSVQQKKIRKEFDKFIGNRPVLNAWQLSRTDKARLTRPISFTRYIFSRNTAPRFLVKDPIALLSADWLYEKYNMKVVCMIRNPLAFVGSLKKAGWDFDFRNFVKQEKLMDSKLYPFKSEIVNLADGKGDFIDRASTLWNTLHHVISGYQEKYPEWKFLWYEKLAADPKEEYRQLFGWLHLKMDPQIEKYIEEFTSEKNPSETRTTGYQPRNAMASLQSWKKRLTPEEAERVMHLTRPVSGRFYKSCGTEAAC